MKTFRALLVASFAVALTGLVSAQTPAPAPAKPGAAAKAQPAAKKEDKKKEEEKEGKIAGQTIARANGTFLGLTLEGGKFKLSFYDKKKKPMTLDVSRGTARWPNLHGPGDNRTVLNPGGDGKSLVGNQFVRGPYAFRLIITLLQGEGDAAVAVETFTVQFTG